MGMPVIQLENLDLESAYRNIIGSVALETAALSHILNAEGEKLQRIVGLPGTDVETLLNINDSVSAMVAQVNEIQESLLRKVKHSMKVLKRIVGEEPDGRIQKTEEPHDYYSMI